MFVILLYAFIATNLTNIIFYDWNVLYNILICHIEVTNLLKSKNYHIEDVLFDNPIS